MTLKSQSILLNGYESDTFSGMSRGLTWEEDTDPIPRLLPISPNTHPRPQARWTVRSGIGELNNTILATIY